MQLSTPQLPLFTEPDDVYHASGAWGSTLARKVLTSPQLAHDYRTGLAKREQTKSLTLGSVWDAFANVQFDMPRLMSFVAVRPEGLDGRTKEGKAWASEHEGMLVISQDEAQAIRLMLDRMPKQCMDLLLAGKMQQVARVDMGGWYAQCKIDCMLPDCIIDVKTTGKPLEDFARSAFNYGYPFQAGWYLGVLEEAMPLYPTKWGLCVTETIAPYRTRLFWLDEQVMEYGMNQAYMARTIIAERTASGNWTDDGDADSILTLPKWVNTDA